VLVHRSVDDTLPSPEEGLRISKKIGNEMPARVGFLSAGGEARGYDLGLPVLGRISSSDDVVRAARRASLSGAFEGSIDELVDLLAQAVPEWGACLRACGIILQGLWAVSVAETQSKSREISEPAMQCCKSLGFYPALVLPAWTQVDRKALVQGFSVTVTKLLEEASPDKRASRGPDWVSVTGQLTTLKAELARDQLDWSDQTFIGQLVAVTNGLSQLFRKYLD